MTFRAETGHLLPGGWGDDASSRPDDTPPWMFRVESRCHRSGGSGMTCLRGYLAVRENLTGGNRLDDRRDRGNE